MTLNKETIIPRHDDSGFINSDTIHYYANTNEKLLKAPVCGIIIELPGLGGSSCLGGFVGKQDYETERTTAFAEKGIVMAYMRPGPWSWGTRGVVRMTDAVVAAIMKKYDLPADTPIVVSGGSMGGLGALIYAAYTAYTLKGVVAACPCTDIFDLFNRHPDFPATIVSAVSSYDMPIEQAMETINPFNQLDRMPALPYFICSDGDDSVCSADLCDKYVEALRTSGHTVTYYRQSGLDHGGFDPEVVEKLYAFMMNIILQK